jgi:hypothetical protein
MDLPFRIDFSARKPLSQQATDGLMDAGAGAISMDAASMDILNAAAGEKWRVKLVDNGKRLVLSRKCGFVLVVR